LKRNSKYPKVKIITSDGTIIVQLLPDKAPKTVANFEKYAKDFYDNLVFHRIIPNFMIQGGGALR